MGNSQVLINFVKEGPEIELIKYGALIIMLKIERVLNQLFSGTVQQNLNLACLNKKET